MTLHHLVGSSQCLNDTFLARRWCILVRQSHHVSRRPDQPDPRHSGQFVLDKSSRHSAPSWKPVGSCRSYAISLVPPDCRVLSCVVSHRLFLTLPCLCIVTYLTYACDCAPHRDDRFGVALKFLLHKNPRWTLIGEMRISGVFHK